MTKSDKEVASPVISTCSEKLSGFHLGASPSHPPVLNAILRYSECKPGWLEVLKQNFLGTALQTPFLTWHPVSLSSCTEHLGNHISLSDALPACSFADPRGTEPACSSPQPAISLESCTNLPTQRHLLLQGTLTMAPL